MIYTLIDEYKRRANKIWVTFVVEFPRQVTHDGEKYETSNLWAELVYSEGVFIINKDKVRTHSTYKIPMSIDTNKMESIVNQSSLAKRAFKSMKK